MDNTAPIYVFDEVTSTNDLALNAPAERAVHGACWAADRQSAGRGRRELGGQRRRWFSPKAANIYMSVMLRPDIDPARASGLTLASAAGVCRALREMTELDIWVKWPNDLYIGAGKVGGILTEAVSGAGGVDAVVVGLGINVNVGAEQVPDELADVMTSLRIEAGRRFDRLRLVPAIRAAVIDWAGRYTDRGYPAIIDTLRDFDRTDGRRVSVGAGERRQVGVCRGLGDRGGLLVDIDGQRECVQAGEVRFEAWSDGSSTTS